MFTQTLFALPLFLLNAAHPLSAQVYKVIAHTPQAIAEGSCVCIGDDGHQSYFLTAAHVVRNATDVLIDQRFSAKVEKAEYQNGIDLALLSLTGYRSTKFYHVAPANDVAQNYRLIGYRNGGPLVSREAVRNQGSWFTCSQQVCTGDSGGPIVTSDGNVVGIINAIDQPGCGNNVYATTNLVGWLNQHCPRCVAPQYRRPVPNSTPKQQVPPPQTVSIEYEKLADVIVARHGEQLRGPQGQPGRDGKIVEPKLPMRRFLIVEGDQVLDDKSFAPDEPVVIDIQRISH